MIKIIIGNNDRSGARRSAAETCRWRKAKRKEAGAESGEPGRGQPSRRAERRSAGTDRRSGGQPPAGVAGREGTVPPAGVAGREGTVPTGRRGRRASRNGRRAGRWAVP